MFVRKHSRAHYETRRVRQMAAACGAAGACVQWNEKKIHKESLRAAFATCVILEIAIEQAALAGTVSCNIIDGKSRKYTFVRR